MHRGLRDATVALLNAARLWLNVNRNSIGEKWYKKIAKQLDNVEAKISTDPEKLDMYAMATVLWLLNIAATFKAMAHIGPQGLRVFRVPEHLDRATTLKLFNAIYDVYKATRECA